MGLRERGRERHAAGGLSAAALAALLAWVTPAPAQPSNDTCAGAPVIEAGLPVFFDTSRATTSGTPGCPMIADLWYRYQATVAGPVTFTTCGSFFDTTLAVRPDTCPAGRADVLACATGGCGTRASVTLELEAGTSYLIQVGGAGDGEVGNGQLLIVAPCEGIEQFLCVHDPLENGVALGWVGSGDYILFRLYLNGALLESFPAGTFSFMHENPPPGELEYRIEAICSTGGTVDATCAVDVLPLQSGFSRGDCNGDGTVDLSDVMALVLAFHGVQPLGPCPDACDAGDDGMITAGDAVQLLDHLFGESGPLPAPQLCGADPTTDVLGCLGGCP